ncbi:MAG TPA: hypothetical protein VLS44_01430, partial [Nitrospira sp.]|nr:hypothetical protein [Nitrospira sp.]
MEVVSFLFHCRSVLHGADVLRIRIVYVRLVVRGSAASTVVTMGENDGGGLTAFKRNDNENTYQVRIAFIERG